MSYSYEACCVDNVGFDSSPLCCLQGLKYAKKNSSFLVTASCGNLSLQYVYSKNGTVRLYGGFCCWRDS